LRNYGSRYVVSNCGSYLSYIHYGGSGCANNNREKNFGQLDLITVFLVTTLIMISRAYKDQMILLSATLCSSVARAIPL
jgi:hypothetical protein